MNGEGWMSRAFDLARGGEGAVRPNPLVGAVVVRDGEVVGEGYHQRFGGPHAEVLALNEAGERARGGTLYVTLEPCCHHGKTPPCTDRIIAAGIRRVVYAVEDPNPPMRGNGASLLRSAGIDVDAGLLKERAERQNEIFLAFARRGTPFVELKLAISLDGRIATRSGDSKWITGEKSRTEAHRLRRKHSAVAVGVTTVIRDDPRLTVRHVEGDDPVPIVLDSRGRIPLSCLLLRPPSRTIVATHAMPEEIERRIAETGARVWRLPETNGRVSVSALLARMAEERLDSLLVEGGGEVAAAFLEEDRVDRMTLFIAPIVLGGSTAVPSVGGVGVSRVADAVRLTDVAIEWLGEDLWYTGRVERVVDTTERSF